MQTKWFVETMAHGGKRHRLYKRNTPLETWGQTPYFVDQAPNKAHYTFGMKYGLFGGGMGELITQADVPYRIAACFGGFATLQPAKAKAESLLKQDGDCQTETTSETRTGNANHRSPFGPG